MSSSKREDEIVDTIMIDTSTSPKQSTLKIDEISDVTMNNTPTSSKESTLKRDFEQADFEESNSPSTKKTLSQNKHTVKARQRLEQMNSNNIARQIERAKAADQAAITYAKRKMKSTETWQNADSTVQNRMLDDLKLQVRNKRIKDGKDWKSLATKLGVGEEGGLYAIDDDHNPAWNDINWEIENADEYEKYCVMDDAEDAKAALTLEELNERIKNLQANAAQEFELREFLYWQKKWIGVKRSLFRKLEALRLGGWVYLESKRSWLGPPGIQKLPTPDSLFTIAEKAMWRAFYASANESEWVELPGPADWWPDNLNEIEKMGFGDSSLLQMGHLKAFALLSADAIPKDGSYKLVFPGDSEFYVMEDNLQSRMYLESFFSK